MDGRKLSHEASELLRMRALKLYRAGEKASAIMKSLGLCRTTIYLWVRKYESGGYAALKASKHPGPACKLSAKQKKELRRMIIGKSPNQYGFDFGLWTRSIVRVLVHREFDIDFSISAIGYLLHEIGITPQKPLQRAYERDVRAVNKWRRETYPALKKHAKNKGFDVFFGDESGFSNHTTVGKTWGKRGETPQIIFSAKKQSVSAFSVVAASGAFWFTTFSGALNTEKFIAILRAFMRYRRRPVILILDNLRVHKSKIVQDFIKRMQGKLMIHYLPAYAPDLNPDEYAWSYLKVNGLRKQPLLLNESITDRVTKDMESLAAKPKIIRSFFEHKSVVYTID